MEKLLNTVLQIYLLMGIYLIQRFLKIKLKSSSYKLWISK